MSKSLGSEIRKLRKIKGLSLDALGVSAGLTGAYLGRLERDEEGFNNPTIETLQSLSKALDVSLGELLQYVDGMIPREDNRRAVKWDSASTQLKEIPLLFGTVNAGAFTISYNDWEGETIGVALKNTNNLVAWRVAGRSMEPRFMDGDIAIIDTSVRFSDGDFVIAENDQGVTIKQLRVLKDKSVELRPLNPDFATIHFKSTEDKRLEILGVVIARHEVLKRKK